MKSPHKGWIIEPIGAAVLFVGEETKTGGLLKRALTHLEGGRALFRNVLLIAQRSGMRTGLEAATRLYAESPLNEQWAKELRESDYASVNAHALIAIWGALETCVEDTIISILINWPDAGSITAEPPLQVDLPLLGTHEDAQRLYRRIENKLRVAGDIVATYDAVLKHFSLETPVSNANAEVLREANAVRNCLLHRGGRVDARAKREAPTLSPVEGQLIRVSSESYLRYHDAIAAWLVALSSSIVASRYLSS